jgi:glycosyltransferase involved in cell wall biosynthesis
MNTVKPLKIAITINYLAVGGSQSFALALAQGMQLTGHEVYVYDFNLPYKTNSLEKLQSPLFTNKKFKYFRFENSIWKKAESLFPENSFPFKLIHYISNKFRVLEFRKFVLNNQIELISSHLMASDTLSYKAIQKLPHIKHCITMHGSYEGFPSSIKKKIRLKVFNRVDGIIYLTPRNISFLNQLAIDLKRIKIKQIYNGYIASVFNSNETISKLNLGINDNDFVFIQVARGTEDKGWKELCEAFELLQKEKTNIKLLLVGAGNYLDVLKENYSQNSAILFYGSSGNPIPLIKIAHVGLLPTYYKGESLPNTVIEYLDCNIPVIASDIGEIRNMIGVNTEHPSGITVKNTELGPVNVRELYNAMDKMVSDRDSYQAFKNNAAFNFSKFGMDNCVNSYLHFFNELLAK